MNLTLRPGCDFRANSLDHQNRRQDNATPSKFLDDASPKNSFGLSALIESSLRDL
jgi:hypothetical protein